MSSAKRALIIACGEYAHAELRRLPSAAADAEELSRVLGDPRIGGFEVQVVRNEPAQAVRERIEVFFDEARPDDLLLLHFSGHGLKSDDGELFLTAHDTRPRLLRSTAIASDFIQQCMKGSRSRRIVLLLDCCYGGAFPQGVQVRAAGDVSIRDAFPAEKIGGRGRAVITASSATEFAFEGDRLGDQARQPPSLFTGALVHGLVTGEADRDEDGWIALGELYDYVFDKVQRDNPSQTPNKSFNIQGELYLARSRRRRIRPQPLPAELQAALADKSRYARHGAVNELRARLANEDLTIAVAAREALKNTARYDVQEVAADAMRALRDIDLQPDVSELHFGALPPGPESPRRTIRLLGPPVARVCSLRATEEWVHALETSAGLEVWVDTSQCGHLEAQLILTAPTSKATIHIDVDVVAPPQAPEPTTPAAPEPATFTADPAAVQLSAEPPPAAGRTATGGQIPGPEGSPIPPPHLPAPIAAASRQPAPPVPADPIPPVNPSSPALMQTGQWTPRQCVKVIRDRKVPTFSKFVSAVAFSPDGLLLASASGHMSVRLWDPASGRSVGPPLAGHTGRVTGVAFNPYRRLLASVGDNTVRLWDPATAQPVSAPLTGHTRPVTTVAFSPDGRLLASASQDNTVRLWDPATAQPVSAPFAGHTDWITSVAFSPDGRLLASASYDNTVRLWDPATGRTVGDPLIGHTGRVMAVAFSPDGRLLASASQDNTVRLWDPATAQPIPTPLVGHTRPVLAVAFSPDGHLAASAGKDNTVRLWDPNTCQPIGVPLTGHKFSVQGLAFSPDGLLLASAGGDLTIRLWGP